MGEKIIKSNNRIKMNSDIYGQVHEASLKQWMKIVVRKVYI